MKKSTVILVHFIFWLFLYWFVFRITRQFHDLVKIETNIYWHSIVLTLGCIVPVYGGYFIYPKLFTKKHILFWTISGIMLIAIFSLAVIIFDDGFDKLSYKNFSSTFIFSVAIALIGGGLRSLFQSVEQKKNQEELEKQNIKSELALLKTQLNPHFLFNTLNNIDALIFEDQQKASESLAKLSDIMRYMLKNTKDGFVELQKEVEYIENYIQLESLRIKRKNFVRFDVYGNLHNIKITPMILLPFIENAFKHCTVTNNEKGIQINLTINDNILIFTCKNQFDSTKADKDKNKGIGLEVLKKRLNLIYPRKHSLIIETEDSIFVAKLEINLNEN